MGIDQDEDAINYVRQNSGENFRLIKGNFRNIDSLANSEGFGRVFGIVYDLGVSSFQLEDETRGFSFQKDTDLDMRMDKDSSVKASDLLNLLTEKKLYEIFTKFGEERNSRAISNSIVRARKVKEFKTTGDLLKVIESVYRIKGDLADK